MNARSYRVKIQDSDLDFKVNAGMTQSSVLWKSEPFLRGDKVLLDITNYYMVSDMFENTQHQVVSVQCVYEIPTSLLKSRSDVYEFYKDSISVFDETYQTHKVKLIDLPKITFSPQPIEAYQKEIDRVFALLSRQN
ncbi:MAG: hypothetical protein EOO46_09305 [Flavobacterium sp.]|nr:MAG: hypothetical protein EOO46_09305 [Flavobacterium sp.]